MYLIEDVVSLEKGFEFAVYPYVAKVRENDENSFHWHQYCEITLVKEGRGRYFVNGTEYGMESGDLIIFNNTEPHGWIGLEEDMHLLVMIFQPEFVSDKLDVTSGDYLRPFAERGGNFKNRIGKEDKNADKIREIMLEIQKEAEEKEEGYRQMIKADVLRVLTFLIRHYQDGSKSNELLREKNAAMHRLEEAFSYIDKRYKEKLTLEEVAASCHMSTNYFSTYFRKAANMNFSEYVSRLRIREARRLLRTSYLSITEIALECGFQNLSNFYRTYHKFFDQSPKDERK
ncbi:MAG: AraC family transcriptional regulator [[Ruminococcus] gnavus]|nr:AraC family transcriptional regulator [Mediterraneibacter gnavus]